MAPKIKHKRDETVENLDHNKRARYETQHQQHGTELSPSTTTPHQPVIQWHRSAQYFAAPWFAQLSPYINFDFSQQQGYLIADNQDAQVLPQSSLNFPQPHVTDVAALQSQASPQTNLESLREKIRTHPDFSEKPTQTCPYTPYNAHMIPILLSTNIEHNIEPADEETDSKEWDSSTWNSHRHAIKLLKSGISREDLGLPETQGTCGTTLVINDVDLYVHEMKVYLATTERGLISASGYLRLRDIPLERAVRFLGTAPKWTKEHRNPERRIVRVRAVPGQHSSQIDLLESDVVSVYRTNPINPNYNLYSSWSYVYCDRVQQFGWFPLELTEPLVNLSDVEKARYPHLPQKSPVPLQLAGAKFKQMKDRDNGQVVSKSLDDYLEDPGYVRNKYTLETTDQNEPVKNVKASHSANVAADESCPEESMEKFLKRAKREMRRELRAVQEKKAEESKALERALADQGDAIVKAAGGDKKSGTDNEVGSLKDENVEADKKTEADHEIKANEEAKVGTVNEADTDEQAG